MKKRIIILCVICLLVIALLACTACGQIGVYGTNDTDEMNETNGIDRQADASGSSPEADYFLFDLLANGTYEVTGIGTCTDTDVVIPATYEGKAVTSIGDWAFYDCTGLTSITIPNSVTEIGGHAFESCSGLTSVTIGSGVTSIGEYAFLCCDEKTLKSAFTSIIVDEANTEYKSIDGVLYSKDGTTLIQCPAAGKSGEFVIPASVTSIEDSAFFGCSNLISITLPSGVTSIGEDTLCDGCIGLTSIIVDKANTAYKSIDGVLYSKDGTTLIQCPAGKSGEFVIPSGVTSIGAYAFSECSSLTSVTIPNSVTSIGEGAFYGCSGLTSVTIGNGVTSIGERAFCICSSLTSITIPNSVISIEYSTFYGCSGLTSITIPNSVKSIGWYAFYECSGLTSVTIPDSVTEIESRAFEYCTGLTSITIPNSVTSIGYATFLNCSGLTSIIVEKGNQKYHSEGNCLIETETKNLIMGCNTSVIPNDGSVTSIGSAAFYNCSGLTSITIPNSVTNIGSSAFRGCTGLTSVTIPSGVTSIGSSAFSGCSGLTSVTIPDSVTSIESSAFSGCSGLTSVTIPNSVTSIGNWAFNGCTALTDVYYDGTEADKAAITIGSNQEPLNSATWHYAEASALAYILKGDDTYEVTGIGTCTDTEILIPPTYNGKAVTSIGYEAFSYCSGLTSVTIGSGVTSIEESAFLCYDEETLESAFTSIIVDEANTEYKSIDGVLYSKDGTTLIQCPAGKSGEFVIPSSVTSIEDSAFSYCSGLTSITIPNSVTSIGNRAFYNCIGLISLTIPNGVKSIGFSAFNDCYKLVEVYNKSSLSITAGSENYGYVGYYAKNIYKEEGGSKLSTTEDGCIIYTDGAEKILVDYTGDQTALTLPSGITEINHLAFYNCTGLTLITISDSVTSIWDGAFCNCSGLTSITIPNSVISIGEGAFFRCSGLTSITIPNSVTSIGDDAFYACTGLTSITYGGTKAQWNGISKDDYWDYDTGNYTIHCTNGDIVKS